MLHTLCQPHERARRPAAAAGASSLTWSTFYDIRRYGGLQIFFRGVHGGSLMLSDPAESVEDFLRRAAAAGVTAYLRHALALAQGAHERCRRQPRAALRATLR